MHFTGNDEHDQQIDDYLKENIFRIDQMVGGLGYDRLTPKEIRSMYNFAIQQTTKALQQGKSPVQPPAAPSAATALLNRPGMTPPRPLPGL